MMAEKKQHDVSRNGNLQEQQQLEQQVQLEQQEQLEYHLQGMILENVHITD